MASKENQMSLDIIAKALPFETYICYIHTLQKAIDDLEHYEKAYKVAPLLFTSKYQRRIKNSVKIAKEELENDK